MNYFKFELNNFVTPLSYHQDINKNINMILTKVKNLSGHIELFIWRKINENFSL